MGVGGGGEGATLLYRLYALCFDSCSEVDFSNCYDLYFVSQHQPQQRKQYWCVTVATDNWCRCQGTLQLHRGRNPVLRRADNVTGPSLFRENQTSHWTATVCERALNTVDLNVPECASFASILLVCILVHSMERTIIVDWRIWNLIPSSRFMQLKVRYKRSQVLSSLLMVRWLFAIDRTRCRSSRVWISWSSDANFFHNFQGSGMVWVEQSRAIWAESIPRDTWRHSTGEEPTEECMALYLVGNGSVAFWI